MLYIALAMENSAENTRIEDDQDTIVELNKNDSVYHKDNSSSSSSDTEADFDSDYLDDEASENGLYY